MKPPKIFERNSFNPTSADKKLFCQCSVARTQCTVSETSHRCKNFKLFLFVKSYGSSRLSVCRFKKALSFLMTKVRTFLLRKRNLYSFSQIIGLIHFMPLSVLTMCYFFSFAVPLCSSGNNTNHLSCPGSCILISFFLLTCVAYTKLRGENWVPLEAVSCLAYEHLSV